MTQNYTYAFSLEEIGRRDITLPVRRILGRLGNRDLTEELAAEGSERCSHLIQTLDVVIILFRDDPTHWRKDWAAEAVRSFRQSGRPVVLPMILDDIVVVDHCLEDPETKALFDETTPEIGDFYDPSIFARSIVRRVDKALGVATPPKSLDRAAKREHAQERMSWKYLLSTSWDQEDRNLLTAATDILDVLLESAIEDRLAKNTKSFGFLFGPDRPLGTFSSKIHLARLLDIISDEERDEIDILRSVRNRFAHDFRLAAAGNDQVIADKVMNLRLGIVDPTLSLRLEKDKDEFPEAVRNQQVTAKIKASLDELFLRLRTRTHVEEPGLGPQADH